MEHLAEMDKPVEYFQKKINGWFLFNGTIRGRKCVDVTYLDSL